MLIHNRNQRTPNSSDYEPRVWHSLICVWSTKHGDQFLGVISVVIRLDERATGYVLQGPCVCVCVFCGGAEKHTVI
jgi:hypothetical protein